MEICRDVFNPKSVVICKGNRTPPKKSQNIRGLGIIEKFAPDFFSVLSNCFFCFFHFHGSFFSKKNILGSMRDREPSPEDFSLLFWVEGCRSENCVFPPPGTPKPSSLGNGWMDDDGWMFVDF